MDCRAGELKYEIGEAYLNATDVQEGLFLILVGRAQAPIWDISPKRRITRKTPAPYVNHYSFHILDPEWGHVTFKLSGHPPFPAQMILNGHEYMARQARKAGILFGKEGNCFTDISDPAAFARIAETLADESAIGRLASVCRRWIYSTCLNCALDAKEREASGFHYQYSVYQPEYSRNLIFEEAAAMMQVMEALVDRNRVRMNVTNLKTILGRKNRPHVRSRNKSKPWQVTVERPNYDLTVFKVHCGKLALKIYSKGERVLRIEAMTRNASVLKCGRSLEKFTEMVHSLKAILERFIESLSCMDQCFITVKEMESLPSPSIVGSTRVGGIDFNRTRIWRVARSLLALAASPRGFSVSELVRHVRAQSSGEVEYEPRQAAYDLKKFQGKQMVRRVGGSRRYEPTPDGLTMIGGLWLLREKVIAPLLGASTTNVETAPLVPDAVTLDGRYQALRTHMQAVLRELGFGGSPSHRQ